MEVVFGHVGSMSAGQAQSLEGLRAFTLHQGPDGATLQVLSGRDGATGLSAWDLTATGPRAEDPAPSGRSGPAAQKGSDTPLCFSPIICSF